MFAYDKLPRELREAIPLRSANTEEVVFANGSSISVGTSLRGSSVQILHVSELGSIAAHYPDRAMEIVSGSFQTVGVGNEIFVESTAEGQEGVFWNLCDDAMRRKARGEVVGPLDFSFHFYGWTQAKEYRIDSEGVAIPDHLTRYFRTLGEKSAIELTDDQKAWYARKEAILGPKIKQEYPATPTEAFEQAIEGAYYAEQMLLADREHRIRDISYDPLLEVEVAWDIGVGDYTAMWFYQRDGKDIRFINFYQECQKTLPHFAGVLKDLTATYGYRYSRNVWPHDGNNTDWSVTETRKKTAEKLGFAPITIIQRQGLDEGIEVARNKFSRCYFDQTKCAEGIKALRQYRRDWNDRLGIWSTSARHDGNSHAADAFRYFALAPEPAPKHIYDDPVYPDHGPV